MRLRSFLHLATLALVGGSALAATGPAAASAAAPRPLAVNPGAPASHLVRPLTAHGQPPEAVASTNWSGFAATGGTGAFRSISANWVEPTGHCSSGDQYSAFWVGLDGYSSHTVEQTGTDVDCRGRTPQYYAWYEIYPNPGYELSGTVRPGDSLSASVTYGNGEFTLSITDHTQRWKATEHAQLGGAKRSSAEIIAEAPSSESGVLPLADFGKASFSAAKANGNPIGSYHPTKIIMRSGGTTKDSISALSGGTSFRATWRHS